MNVKMFAQVQLNLYSTFCSWNNSALIGHILLQLDLLLIVSKLKQKLDSHDSYSFSRHQDRSFRCVHIAAQNSFQLKLVPVPRSFRDEEITNHFLRPEYQLRTLRWNRVADKQVLLRNTRYATRVFLHHEYSANPVHSFSYLTTLGNPRGFLCLFDLDLPHVLRKSLELHSAINVICFQSLDHYVHESTDPLQLSKQRLLHAVSQFS